MAEVEGGGSASDRYAYFDYAPRTTAGLRSRCAVLRYFLHPTVKRTQREDSRSTEGDSDPCAVFASLRDFEVQNFYRPRKIVGR